MTDQELLAEAKKSTAGTRHKYPPYVAGLIDRIASALAAHQWRPIETAPSKGKILLAYMNSRDTEGARTIQVVDASISNVMKTTEATHWKPATLPEDGE